MLKNLIQFQKGYSLPELFRDYGTEIQCKEALFQWRWPDGFCCPECHSASYCTLKTRDIYQCNHCHHQTSLTSGTLFDYSKLPLTTWFLAIYLVTQAKTGISALALRRELGVSYNTAWLVKQKIMQAMKERDDSQPLTGVIQVDDAYWGGQRHGGKRGRGAQNKTPFVAAVSIDEDGHPQHMNLQVVQGFQAGEIAHWAQKHITPESHVVSDGLRCFSAVLEVADAHTSITTGGGYTSVQLEEFTWVNTMIGNVKNAIKGTYHAINHKHLPRYLAEFCYRFNRRFRLHDMLARFIYIALRTPPMPLRLIKLAEPYT